VVKTITPSYKRYEVDMKNKLRYIISMMLILILSFLTSCEYHQERTYTHENVIIHDNNIVEKTFSGKIKSIVVNWGDIGLYANPSLVTITFENNTYITFYLWQYFTYTTKHPVLIGEYPLTPCIDSKWEFLNDIYNQVLQPFTFLHYTLSTNTWGIIKCKYLFGYDYYGKKCLLLFQSLLECLR
jgi:hypothetical protein